MDPPAPLPRKRIAVLAAAHMAHAYSISSIFAYAGIMCVELGWADDEDSAGYIAGFLGSVLTFGRLPTASLWGQVRVHAPFV